MLLVEKNFLILCTFYALGCGYFFNVKNPFITNLKNWKPQDNDFFYNSLKLEFYCGFFIIKTAGTVVLLS